jgi:hypothetical protein
MWFLTRGTMVFNTDRTEQPTALTHAAEWHSQAMMQIATFHFGQRKSAGSMPAL